MLYAHNLHGSVHVGRYVGMYVHEYVAPGYGCLRMHMHRTNKHKKHMTERRIVK
jgi:hypothetical protein